MSKTLKKYLITSVLALLLTFLIALSRGVFEKEKTVDVLHVLIDSTFVVSVLFTGFGLLIFSANEGTFDMIAYGMTSFLSLFKKDRENYLKYKTYVDYKEAKADNKHSFAHIVLVGLAIFVACLIFIAFYESLK